MVACVVYPLGEYLFLIFSSFDTRNCLVCLEYAFPLSFNILWTSSLFLSTGAWAFVFDTISFVLSVVVEGKSLGAAWCSSRFRVGREFGLS